VKQKHSKVNIIFILMLYGNLNEIKCTYTARRLHVSVPTTHQSRNVKKKKNVLEECGIPLQIKYTYLEQYCGGGELYRVAQKPYDTHCSSNIESQETLRHPA
jgi:hypothetical protein